MRRLFLLMAKHPVDAVLDDIILRGVDERVGSDVEQDDCFGNVPGIVEHVQRDLQIHKKKVDLVRRPTKRKERIDDDHDLDDVHLTSCGFLWGGIDRLWMILYRDDFDLLSDDEDNVTIAVHEQC